MYTDQWLCAVKIAFLLFCPYVHRFSLSLSLSLSLSTCLSWSFWPITVEEFLFRRSLLGCCMPAADVTAHLLLQSFFCEFNYVDHNKEENDNWWILGQASSTSKDQLIDSDMLGDISKNDDGPRRESRDQASSQSETPSRGPHVIGLITEWMSSVSFIKGIRNS